MRQLIILILIFCLKLSSFAQGSINIGTGTGTTGTSSFIWYNAKSYGAIGNGIANETQALQSAINACKNGGGGTVFIPAGTYRYNKIESYTSVTLRGDGYAGTTTLKSISADTGIVIHNLPPALAGLPFSSNANTLIEDIYMDGDSICNVGFYVDRAANFRIGRVFITKFMNTGMYLKNSLIGTIEGCYLFKNRTGLKGYSDYSNNTATTLVTIKNTSFYLSPKWGAEWQGGGQLSFEDSDWEGCGAINDTTTGGVYYHDNIWPGGLRIRGGWAEENYGRVVCIMNNVTGVNFNTSYTIHSITDFQDLGQHYGFASSNIYIRGNNQLMNITGSTTLGATNNIIVDGTNSEVDIVGKNIFSNTPSNITRNGAAIVVK